MSSKETKSQKIHRIVGEIEKSIRAEENYLKKFDEMSEKMSSAQDNLDAQIKVTKILRQQLEIETSTMRKAKGA